MPVVSINEPRTFDRLWKDVFMTGSRKGDIHILTACEVDAICACKILEKLCIFMNLGVKVFPAVDWFQVQKQIESQHDDFVPPGVIVLLNCGGAQHLRPLLDSSGSTVIVCFDTHRPYRWENLMDEDRVHMIDDDPQAESYEEDDLLADSAGKRRRILPGSSEPIFGGSSSSTAPEGYYNKAWYATPTSLTILKLAEHLNGTDKSYLWHAMVGISQYEEYCLTPQSVMNIYTSHLNALLDAPTEAFGGEENRVAIAKKSITYEDDIRAFLYRHWPLANALRHTGLVYGRMRLHKERGSGHLSQFFGETGVTRSEEDKIFRNIPGHIQVNLKVKFKRMERRHNLEGLVNKTFVRFFGRFVSEFVGLGLSELSASDVLHIATALLEVNISDGVRDILERDDTAAEDAGANGGGGGNEELLGVQGAVNNTATFGGSSSSSSTLEDKKAESYERECNNTKTNFWKTYDCLAFRDSGLLKEGLDAALNVQQLIVQQAKIFLDEKSCICHKKMFYWVRFNVGSQDIFRRPLYLKRLALWLIEVQYKFALRRAHRCLPQMVVAADNLKNSVLVVGQMPHYVGENQKSVFPVKFLNAAKAANRHGTCNYKYENWDPDVIEIGEKGFKYFWRELMG